MGEPQPVAVPQRLPLCLFAISENPQQAKTITKQMNEEGINVRFLSRVEMEDNLRGILDSQSECFAIFMDSEYLSIVTEHLDNKMRNPRPYWVALASRMTSQQSSRLLNAGISDILQLPVHPVTYKSRARMLLARWVHRYTIDDDIVLPPGIVRPVKHDAPKRGQMETGGSPKNIISRATDFFSSNGRSIYSPSKGASHQPFTLTRFGNRKWDKDKLSFFNQVRPLITAQDNLFQNVEGRKKQAVTFKEASEESVKCLMWAPGQGYKLRTTIKDFVVYSGLIQVAYPSGQNEQSIRLDFVKHQVDILYFNIQLRRASLFLADRQSQLKWSPEGFYLSFPTELFSVQRRGDFRFEPGTRRPILVSSSLSAKPLRVKDISGGGCCLGLTKLSFETLTLGATVAEFTFDICGEKIKCPATARWLRKTMTPQGEKYLAGFAFNGLSAEQREGIQLFVMEESANYLKKYIDETNSDMSD
jgi:hypothetical protein